ncbi:MAG: hypothetical protein NTZ16_14915, partial [Verrucomicrobia bacterium]|nr:hypothetical protein [Verrucomicrobiota bacterium]
FRLFMPALGHVLHLERTGLLVVQNLMGVLFLWATLALACKATNDKIAATLFVLGVALTFPALWFFNCFSTNLDGPGYLLLTAALLFPNALLIFSLLFLASFVDERSFACFGFVVLWWKLTANKPEAWTWRRIFAVDRYVLAAAAAILLHGCIRHYLTVARGFHLPTGDSAGVGFANVRESWKVFSPSILAPFKGLSLFAVLAALVAAASRNWALLFCTAAVTAVMLLQSFAVGDHTRSLAYGFPLILLSVKILKELDAGLDLRKLAALTCSFCLLIPSFNVTGGVVSWFTPVLPKALRWLF